MNVGKEFEASLKDSVPTNVYYFRIKDSATSFGDSNSSNIRFSPNNPYDQFLFLNGDLFPMELKSTIGTSISIQQTKEEKGKMIKLHQIKGLEYADSFDRIHAGFVFDFRTSGITYFMRIGNFKEFQKNTNKKSINEKDIVEYGCIIIDKTLKKVNYRYNITKLLADIVK